MTNKNKNKKAGFLPKVALAFGLAAIGTSPFSYTVIKNGGFTDEEGARKTLTDNNFTPTKVGGYSWVGCGDRSDIIVTKFEATNLKGDRVSGVVCKNVLGKSGYRLD